MWSILSTGSRRASMSIRMPLCVITSNSSAAQRTIDGSTELTPA